MPVPTMVAPCFRASSSIFFDRSGWRFQGNESSSQVETTSTPASRTGATWTNTSCSRDVVAWTTTSGFVRASAAGVDASIAIPSFLGDSSSSPTSRPVSLGLTSIAPTISKLFFPRSAAAILVPITPQPISAIRSFPLIVSSLKLNSLYQRFGCKRIVKAMTALLVALFLLQDPEPGLVAEYFTAPGKPAFVRVEPDLNHSPVTGEFHGTRLAENFTARWTGLLRCEQAGLYNFYVESDDGCRLYIDNELVIDNSAGRLMEQKADRLTLPAGDHALRFEYTQASGPAGVNLQWKPPKAGRQMVPAKVLFHSKGAEKIEWDRDAWEKLPAPPPMKAVEVAKPGRYATIDFGPFVTRGVGPASEPVALAGHLLRLSHDSFVCFDPKLLRVAAVWTGSFLTYPAEKDGVAGFPTVGGKIWFKTPAVPGWGDAKVRWRGLYVYGKDVVLSYTVDGNEILELHGLENGAFTRTIEVRKVDAPVRVLVAPENTDAGLTGEGAALQKREGRLELEISKPGRYKIAIPNRKVCVPEPLEQLTKGGGLRWAETVVTQGAVGKEPGAYQLDTLTVPYENPWDSYMRIVALDFFPDGRAAIETLDGDVWIVSGID